MGEFWLLFVFIFPCNIFSTSRSLRKLCTYSEFPKLEILDNGRIGHSVFGLFKIAPIHDSYH